MSQHESRQRITVLLCIAEPLLQVGVRVALEAETDVEIADPERLSLDQRIDVIVADATTATRLAHDARQLDLHPGLQHARILAISTQAREHAVRCALEQGVHGFVLTRSPVADLLAGVRALARGGNYLCPQVARQMTQTAQRDMLTSREDEVLRLLTLGLCNKSIARDLEIAVGTVKTHVKSIMSKLDANCRTEAARIATERGLIDMPEPSSKPAETSSSHKHWLPSISGHGLSLPCVHQGT
ncbi:MAG: response regulator transcription factor [Pseudomonadota bacterium]|jgi:DNA-binding NarL/FixJ family response regulator|uniref:response regulator transcription factor n=2 Tax=Burkholderiales TaxID=80840 RepID=UPI0010F9976A|nr:response regulator transcription factor [Burkholderia sp. 4M9327F10]